MAEVVEAVEEAVQRRRTLMLMCNPPWVSHKTVDQSPGLLCTDQPDLSQAKTPMLECCRPAIARTIATKMLRQPKPRLLRSAVTSVSLRLLALKINFFLTAFTVLQPATAGMLPPSDSEDESSEEEESKPKPSPASKPPRPAVASAPKK